MFVGKSIRLFRFVKLNTMTGFSDARNMAKDVQNTFLKIFKEVGEMSVDSAQKLLKDMERQRRYQADVWS
jgi:hypothetical protein